MRQDYHTILKALCWGLGTAGFVAGFIQIVLHVPPLPWGVPLGLAYCVTGAYLTVEWSL